VYQVHLSTSAFKMSSKSLVLLLRIRHESHKYDTRYLYEYWYVRVDPTVLEYYLRRSPSLRGTAEFPKLAGIYEYHSRTCKDYYCPDPSSDVSECQPAVPG